MEYCKSCVMPTSRPGYVLNTEGICNPCLFSVRKHTEIDWDKNLDEFVSLASTFKSDHNYDCIIPVSGGKDSTRQAIWVRDKLKLKPLLVCCTYPPEQITELGASNLSNLISTSSL